MLVRSLDRTCSNFVHLTEELWWPASKLLDRRPQPENRNLNNDDAVATVRHRHRLLSIKNQLRAMLLHKNSKRPNNALWLPYNPFRTKGTHGYHHRRLCTLTPRTSRRCIHLRGAKIRYDE